MHLLSKALEGSGCLIRHGARPIEHLEIPELAEIMLRHGYSDAVVSGVLGENWLRVARTVWK